MKDMKFVKIGTEADNYLHLVYLSRLRKLNADTIIKAGKTGDTSLIIVIWRREGAVDMFMNNHNDLFDGFVITDESISCIPMGTLSETNIEKGGRWDVLLSESTVGESELPNLISKISEIYGINVSPDQILMARYSIPKITIEI